MFCLVGRQGWFLLTAPQVQAFHARTGCFILSLSSFFQFAQSRMMRSVGLPHLEQLRRHPKFHLSMLCCLGLMLTTGCFQQRYEPANWESASRPAVKKRPAPAAPAQTGTSLPGKQSAATTLPGRKQSGGNSTLPGRGRPSPTKEKPTQVGPGAGRGNTTLPERPRRGGTTLPERSRSEQAEPLRTNRDSNTTLPGREPRRSSDPSRNSGTTLPGRR